MPFSFCIIFGQTEEDLINNARFAQVMYNSKYQGFTPPTRPTAYAETGVGSVTIYWDDAAENSSDVLTGYYDFEGYKIYKSLDVVLLGDLLQIGFMMQMVYLLGGALLVSLIYLQRRIHYTVCIQMIIIVKKISVEIIV